MRTSRLSCRPGGRLDLFLQAFAPARAQRSKSAANSGTATPAAKGRCRAVDQTQKPRWRTVDMKVDRPSASSPITPEVTEDSTESNRRRRDSICRVLFQKRVALALELPGHLIEERPSIAISSSPAPRRPARRDRPAPTRCAAPASRPTGRDSRSANHSPARSRQGS
jgi:hypothetical protein